ncbi:MAG: sigma-70 family RNA polymerase sigma factor, partial [Spirochaetes bacterium]|nr:sigma-70 family RNA polymerase sigma factor [Spirochaetota bacterium]
IKKDQTNNIDFYFLTEVPLPDEEFLIIEQHERLKLAMEQLDQRCQAVLTAIFNASSEKTYRDIAQDLNMPLNSLGPTRIRCLKKLKIIFENLED